MTRSKARPVLLQVRLSLEEKALLRAAARARAVPEAAVIRAGILAAARPTELALEPEPAA